MEKPKKKLTLHQKIKRWKKRMRKKYRSFDLMYMLAKILLFFAVLALMVMVCVLLLKGSGDDPYVNETAGLSVTAAPVGTPAAAYTPVPTSTCTPTPTPMPAPTPTPVPVFVDGLPENLYYQPIGEIAESSDPNKNNLLITKVYADGEETAEYLREDEIHMSAGSVYSQLEGITTFRGSNYRDSASYGAIPENPSKMSVVWTKSVGRVGEWSGVGWTGQACAVRWPEETRLKMNINSDKKNKEGLVEVIYATLDGKIYFLDLDDGNATRNAINIKAPIKGTLSIDPRGYPLLYCGQGIYELENGKVDCGTRIWSLYDQKLLYFLNGKDSYALRAWRAFDSSPLVDAETDTMLTVGENGVLYSVKLNTTLTENSVSVNPSVDRYVYKQSIDGKVGSENSPAVYDHYIYFASNIGIIQCVDLNTMELVWCFNAQDDIDASLVIEVEADGTVALYGANELDIRGKRGNSQMFKLNALTGELIWHRDSDSIYQSNDNGGGSFATPCVGKQDLSGLVYFHIARTTDSGGMLYALDKATGETVWKHKMGQYGWATPTCVYTPSGKGYLLVGSSNGDLMMFDGLTGERITRVNLGSNIEASPVVFDDMIVIGTRGGKICGVRIK